MNMQGHDLSKGVVFNKYDGTGSFQSWKEEMQLMLMANDLWGFVDGTDSGDKKSADSRRQKAYAVIALNLSHSCRDCLRSLDSQDPKEAWGAVIARFDKPSASAKMALLDSVLNLRVTGTVLEYISSFYKLLPCQMLFGLGEGYGT
jgi:hypothetical protein